MSSRGGFRGGRGGRGGGGGRGGHRPGSGGVSKPRMGGHVGEEQRKYFVNAMEEVKNLGSTMFAKKDKKAFEKQKMVQQNRKVERRHIPLKSGINKMTREKNRYDELVMQAMKTGGVMPKKPSSMKNKDKEESDRGLEMRNGKFSNGTHFLSKSDVKSVYTKKK